MIKTLFVKNYKLIDNALLDFDKGFYVITGETGAGKSMLLSSLSVLTKQRLTESVVKNEEKEASISLLISEKNEEILFKRSFKKSSSSCFINDDVVTSKVFAERLSKYLVLSSQHEQYSLIKKENVILVIDKKANLTSKIEESKDLYSKLYKLQKEIDEINECIKNTKKEKDYLEFVIKEIKSVSPIVGEDEQIKIKLKDIKSSSIIKNSLKNIQKSITENENDGVFSNLNSIISNLQKIKSKSENPIYTDLEKKVFDIYENIEEISVVIDSQIKNYDITDEDIDELNSRDALISKLKMKYGGTIENVLKFYNEAVTKIENADSGVDKIAVLEKEYEVIFKEYKNLRHSIYLKRVECAKELSSQTQKITRTLNMPNSEFKIQIKEGEGFKEDELVVLFSANLGGEAKDVSKIASGGEISRLYLAFMLSSIDIDEDLTIVFDEIDTGISGKTSITLSDYIASLSLKCQIIAITHQASIASKASGHIFVKKTEMDGKTSVSVKLLNKEERVSEISRLLSGTDTESSLTLSSELLGV